MYPNNIKVKKVSKLRIMKEILACLKERIKKHIKDILHDRKRLSKIFIAKFHI